MKNTFLPICFLLASFSGWAQLDFQGEESFLEDRQVFIPSLSKLGPAFPESTIMLREVDFSRKKKKLQVDMVAIMERERRHTPRQVDIEAPFQLPSSKKQGDVNFELSDGIRQHSRGWNYDPYTGKTRNAAYGQYRQMRAGMFNGYHGPSFRSRYYSPYSPYYR